MRRVEVSYEEQHLENDAWVSDIQRADAASKKQMLKTDACIFARWHTSYAWQNAWQ
jgi:hypothetical protein